jgi:hypothetical protein
MQKLTITKVYKNNKDKQGNLFKFSSGEPYTKLAILTQEYGDKKWISGFLSEGNKDWKDGDVVEVIVEEKGEWLNFKIPESPLEKRVRQLESRIADLDKELEGKFAQLKGSLVLELTGKFQTSEDYKNNNSEMDNLVQTMRENDKGEVVNPDDIPF